MSKKHKQSRKATKISKRTKGPAQTDEEPDTGMTSTPVDDRQITPTPQTDAPEVPVEFQQADAVTTEAAGSETPPKTTRSEAAKANIKEELRLHQIAGRPTKQQLILVFGKGGYLLTWPKRTEKFGITPENFQAALAKGVPAVPLTPVAEPNVEKTKETV
jgi:hypothetical protein